MLCYATTPKSNLLSCLRKLQTYFQENLGGKKHAVDKTVDKQNIYTSVMENKSQAHSKELSL